MPGSNLTRVEAIERRSVVDAKRYDVSIDLTSSTETFRTVTRVEFAGTEGASTFIDAITDQVHSVRLNDTDLDPAEVADGVRIALPNLAADNVLVIEADMRYMNTGEGLHRSVDPADGEVYLYTQFEVPDARRMYPCFEQPDLKAEFTFHVTAPENWTVLSNQPAPAPEPLGDGKAVWHFGATPKMSTYITALIAGPYASWRDELVSTSGRTIPLGIFCRQSLAEYMDADYIFNITKQGFDYYERHFGVPYPFDKYDQIFVPEYNAGAMENIGCVTFTESYVFRSRVPDAMRERRVVTILHELGHMWFGDLVTMKWWNDLWLNESFAEFISTIATAEATEWHNDWVTFLSSEKTWAVRQDQLPSTHPVVAEIRDLADVEVNFDGITYAKGGSILKQLFFWVGREAFFTGIKSYFTKHAYSNTELNDLLVELEAASGRDLREWSKLWLETAGVNTLRPEFEVDESGNFTSFAITQSAAPDYPTIRPHRLAVGIYSRTDAGIVRTHRVELDVDGERTEVPELVGQHRGDLILVNDDDLAYAKIRLDEQSLRTVHDHAGEIVDPLPRALAIGSLWDATRDGELPVRQFIETVLAHVGAETESTTRRTILGQLVTSVERFSRPEYRSERRIAVADALWALAQAAQPGSDAQFSFVRSFTQFATTAEQLDIVQGLFDETTKLPGLDVDTDLGWELLFALVAGGRAAEPEIAARLAEDVTSDGQRSAAIARASIPTAEAKAAAWDLVWTNAGATNDIVRAVPGGFWRTKDDSLLAPFVGTYFDELNQIWESRSFHIAEYLVEGFFPGLVETERVVGLASAWLNDNAEAPAPLRRLVAEGLDDAQRALRVQAADSN